MNENIFQTDFTACGFHCCTPNISRYSSWRARSYCTAFLPHFAASFRRRNSRHHSQSSPRPRMPQAVKVEMAARGTLNLTGLETYRASCLEAWRTCTGYSCSWAWKVADTAAMERGRGYPPRLQAAVTRKASWAVGSAYWTVLWLRLFGRCCHCSLLTQALRRSGRELGRLAWESPDGMAFGLWG